MILRLIPIGLAGNTETAWGALFGSLLPGIFWREFVAALAMGFSLLSQRIGRATHSKPSEICVLVFRKYLSRRPTKFKSLVYRVPVKTSFFRPLGYIKSFAAISNENIASAIIRLFFPTGPATIGKIITKSVVFAVKSISRRARPHVRDESFISIPFWAHFYSATSIMLECRVFRIVAALPHGNPSFVGGIILPFHEAFILQSFGEIK